MYDQTTADLLKENEALKAKIQSLEAEAERKHLCTWNGIRIYSNPGIPPGSVMFIGALGNLIGNLYGVDEIDLATK